jgi:hypothetical protein
VEHNRLVCALSSQCNWSINHLDVKIVFLHGELHEQIFMHQPKGFVEPRKEHLFCKLKKALYGLKQSPWARYQKISIIFFEDQGLVRIDHDHNMYYKIKNGNILILLLHVNDLLTLMKRSNCWRNNYWQHLRWWTQAKFYST